MYVIISASSGSCPATALAEREEAYGAVVCGDHAEHVPGDDGDDLEGGEGPGTQRWGGFWGVVSAQCHAYCAWSFDYQEGEVVGDEIAECDRYQ